MSCNGLVVTIPQDALPGNTNLHVVPDYGDPQKYGGGVNYFLPWANFGTCSIVHGWLKHIRLSTLMYLDNFHA